MLLLLLIAIFALAFTVGLIGNISGIGGGVMILLFLIYLFNFSPLDAAGLSLLTLVFSSMTGFIRNVKQNLVDIRLFLFMATIAIGGAIAGTVIASYVPSRIFKGVFAVFLVCLGLFSVYASHRQTKAKAEIYDTSTALSPDTGVVSMLAGIVSGFVGIGIGGVMATYLTAIKRTTPNKTIATIISATLPVTVVGASIHFYYTGFINIAYAPPLVIGAFIGAMLGSWVMRKAPQANLRFFQGYIIIAFGTLSTLLYLLSTY